jgi:hypothetical protein
MRLPRRWRWWAWALALVTAVPLAAAECLYRLALAQVESLPPRPDIHAVPAVVARTLWASQEGATPVRVRPLWPWNILREVVALALSSGHAPRSEGLRLADQAAREWTFSRLEAPRRWRSLEVVTLSIWMTREWSAEELLAFHAEHMRGGLGVQGTWTAAHVYLGKDWERLDMVDTALLAAIAHFPSARQADPWCNPESTRARRDALLRELHRAGVLDALHLEEALRAPLGLAARPTRRRPCPGEREGQAARRQPSGL